MNGNVNLYSALGSHEVLLMALYTDWPSPFFHHSFIFIFIFIWRHGSEWIARGTLNPHIVGSNSSAASWLLCNIFGKDVNFMCASPHQGVKLVPRSDGVWRNNVHSK